MYFTQSLLVGASCLLALVHAQANIAFTKTPVSVSAGQSTTIEWGGGDGSVSPTKETHTCISS